MLYRGQNLMDGIYGNSYRDMHEPRGVSPHSGGEIILLEARCNNFWLLVYHRVWNNYCYIS